MKVTYDTQVDTLTIILSDAPITESDEDKPGVILDYDAQGNVVSLEVLDASTRVVQPKQKPLVNAMLGKTQIVWRRIEAPSLQRERGFFNT